MTPLACYPVEPMCKVRVYRDRAVYLTWLQLFASGEIGYANASW